MSFHPASNGLIPLREKTVPASKARRKVRAAVWEEVPQELQPGAVNTDQSAPTVRPVEYYGPSSGEMLGMSLLQGLGSFASNYAMQKMSLGLGAKAETPQVSSSAGLYSFGTGYSGVGLKMPR